MDRGELAPGRVIGAALAAGALTPADVVQRGVTVELVGRSHAVYRVSIGGEARFYVKSFGPTRGATDGLVERERAVLGLARDRPAVAALVPDAWPWQSPPVAAEADAGATVATAAVRGAEAWTLDRAGGGERAVGEAWAALVEALARPLAAFHRATRDLARPGAELPPGLQAAEPWGLRLMDGDAPPELWATPVTAALLEEAAADPALVRGLRAARALWRPLALVHADLKHDNVLVEVTPDGLRVRVIDWEMARIGDPAWDLAGLVARLAVVRGEARPWPDVDLAGAALLIGAYAAASRLRPPALARRLMLYSGAVLLMMALQHGSTLAPEADLSGPRALVMKARATFRRAERLSAALIANLQNGAA